MMDTNKPGAGLRRILWFLLGFEALVLGLHVEAILNPTTRNWGVHHYAFLPTPWVWWGAAAAVVAGFLVAGAGRFPRVPPWLSSPIVVLGALALFWSGRDRLYFLGDGALWIRSIESGKLLTYIEPASLYSLFYLNRWFGAPEASLTFAVVSVVCGGVYVGLALWAARLVVPDPAGRVLFFGIVVAAGFTRLFYGYAETYPILAVLVILYLTLGIRACLGLGRSRPALVFLVLGIPFHITMVLLFPSLLVLFPPKPLLKRARSAGLFRASRLIPIIAAILMVVGAAATLLWSTYNVYLEKFLPLSIDPGNLKIPYTLLDPDHWRDLFQEQLLLGPFAVLLVLPLLTLGVGRPVDRTSRFLLVAAIPWSILSFFFYRELGPIRDWDLFAAAAIPWALFTGRVLARHDWEGISPRMIRVTLSGLIAISVFHLVGWVASDLDPPRAIARYTQLHGDSSTASIFARTLAQEEIYKFHKDREDFHSAADILRDAHRLHLSHVRIATNLASVLMRLGELREARTVLETCLERRPEDARLYYMMAMLERRDGDLHASRDAFAWAIELDPEFSHAYFYLSRVYRELGSVVDAESVLARAIDRFPETQAFRDELARMRALGNALDGEKPRTYPEWMKEGVSLETGGEMEGALVAYRKALALDPERPETHFGIARTQLALRDSMAALQTMRAFADRDSTSDLGQRALEIIQVLEARP